MSKQSDFLSDDYTYNTKPRYMSTTIEVLKQWRWLTTPHHARFRDMPTGDAILAYYGDMPYTLRMLWRRYKRGASVPTEFRNDLDIWFPRSA